MISKSIPETKECSLAQENSQNRHQSGLHNTNHNFYSSMDQPRNNHSEGVKKI